MTDVTIYVDESGNFSFTDKISKFFSMGYVCILGGIHKDSNKVNQALKKINHNLSHKNQIYEFKFSRDSEKIQDKFLAAIKNMDVELGAICVKKTTTEDLSKSNSELYLSLLSDVITTVLEGYQSSFRQQISIKFILDRVLTDSQIRVFESDYKRRASHGSGPLSDARINISINQANSQNTKMIQVADYVAGSVRRKFETGNSRVYDILRPMFKWQNMPNG